MHSSLRDMIKEQRRNWKLWTLRHDSSCIITIRICVLFSNFVTISKAVYFNADAGTNIMRGWIPIPRDFCLDSRSSFLDNRIERSSFTRLSQEFIYLNLGISTQSLICYMKRP